MRVSFHETWLKVARVIGASRSTCYRRQIGCVITNKDNDVVATGYNGAPRGQEHCINTECLRDRLGIASGTNLEVCRAVHAEMNALQQAGRQARGSTLYVNCAPCTMCAKVIINAGVTSVVYSSDYVNTEGLQVLQHSGIRVKRVEVKHAEPTTTKLVEDNVNLARHQARR